MLSSYFTNIDIYSWQIISILILSGVLVGIINTLAGSGTAISYYLFILLGLPPHIANGRTSCWTKYLLRLKYFVAFAIVN